MVVQTKFINIDIIFKTHILSSISEPRFVRCGVLGDWPSQSINEDCDMKLKRNMATRRMWMNTSLPKLTKARTSNTTLSIIFIIKVCFVKLNPALL